MLKRNMLINEQKETTDDDDSNVLGNLKNHLPQNNQTHGKNQTQVKYTDILR